MSEFIQRLTVKNYGPIKDASVLLTPLHAFIGPNDSGKSTLLRAVRVATQFAWVHVGDLFEPGDLTDAGFRIEVAYPDQLFYAVSASPRSEAQQGGLHETAGENAAGGSPPQIAHDRLIRWNYEAGGLSYRSEAAQVRALGERLRPAAMVRLDPDELRLPAELFKDGDDVRFRSERGAGLAAIYDVLMNRDVEAFLPILNDIRRLFPGVSKFRLKNVKPSTKAIEIGLSDGRLASAALVSEGLLYYLAFAALPHLERPSVVLLEEPENGLHPARIADVMRLLREVSKTTQVLIATHSPLVINEMQPEEVTVVTRSVDKGTELTPIGETHNFKKRSSVYALGELWLSYANGVDEGALVRGRDELGADAP